MFDALIAVLSPYLVLISLAGVVLGIFWGALPGLSTTMAMMLLIGLSAGMSLETSLAFMLGVYTGSTFGGSVSAVLINIPGTPDSIPTMMEGYPLAKQGKGGEALGLSITASFLGSWIGILLLILCMPVILSIALNFRSWEMFLLAVIGVSICGTMSAGTMPLKGWITGWIGMLLAFVGYDTIHGVARFTYDLPALYDGISYVAVLIGLFGLAEVLKTLPERSGSAIPEKIGRTTPSIGLLMRYLPAGLRSGLIGTIVGAIPGAGANIAAFLAYDIGRRRAKPEERAKWGKGSFEGIVCAESANNANMGGSMLPTLTLGIPGSAPAAALMAALQMKNVLLGPDDRDRPARPHRAHLWPADRREHSHLGGGAGADPALREALLAAPPAAPRHDHPDLHHRRLCGAQQHVRRLGRAGRRLPRLFPPHLPLPARGAGPRHYPGPARRPEPAALIAPLRQQRL